MRAGWLDRRPTWARDLIIGAISAEVAWATAHLVPALESAGGWWPVLAPAVVVALGAITRWTQAYGRRDDQAAQHRAGPDRPSPWP